MGRWCFGIWNTGEETRMFLNILVLMHLIAAGSIWHALFAGEQQNSSAREATWCARWGKIPEIKVMVVDSIGNRDTFWFKFKINSHQTFTICDDHQLVGFSVDLLSCQPPLEDDAWLKFCSHGILQPGLRLMIRQRLGTDWFGHGTALKHSSSSHFLHASWAPENQELPNCRSPTA